MRIYLHIGIQHTQEREVQRALANGTPALTAAGALYPLTGRAGADDRTAVAHHRLARDLVRQTPDPALWSELLSELDESPHEIALISSERLAALRSARPIETLAEHLADHEVAVVAYLPRQDLLLHAAYREAVVERDETRSLPEFRKAVRWGGDYERLLDRWASVFGADAILARPLERQQLTGGNALRDLLALAGATVEPARMPLRRGRREYPRSAIECLRRLRVAAVDAETIADVLEIYDHVYDRSVEPGDVLSPKQRATLLRRLERPNAAVARRYLDRSELFADAALADQEAWDERHRDPAGEVLATLDDARRVLRAGPSR